MSERVIKFFEKHIRRQLDLGSNVMGAGTFFHVSFHFFWLLPNALFAIMRVVVAHGFVQRVLIKHLLALSNEEWAVHSTWPLSLPFVSL